MVLDRFSFHSLSVVFTNPSDCDDLRARSLRLRASSPVCRRFWQLVINGGDSRIFLVEAPPRDHPRGISMSFLNRRSSFVVSPL